jgi:HAD superfamily hydrolase (TIGR01509 family)
VLAARDITVTHDQFLTNFGQRNDAILSAWLGADTPAAQIREIGEAKEARYRELIASEGITPLPGAAEWVKRLHEEGWRQAIASSAPRANVEVMIHVLGLIAWLDAVISAEDVRHGKPDPEVFLTAAAALHAPTDRCIVVEDAEAGIEAARRAGMRSIGVGPGAVQAADIVAAQLDDYLPMRSAG